MSSQLKIDLLTLFPEMISGFLSESIIGRARENGILDISVHNLRDWATDKHHITDDRPFGGGRRNGFKTRATLCSDRRAEDGKIQGHPDGS